MLKIINNKIKIKSLKQKMKTTSRKTLNLKKEKLENLDILTKITL